MAEDSGRVNENLPAMQGTLNEQPYLTRQRRELIQWLTDRAPSFLDGYLGALQLLHMRAFPARVHFICHAVRDFYRSLPASLGFQSQKRRSEVYPQMVEELCGLWRQFPPSTTRSSFEMDSDARVSPQVYRQIETIVRKSAQLAEQRTVGSQFAMALFRSMDRPESEFIQAWIIKAFDKEYDFFVKRAHLAGHIDKVPNDDGLIDHFEAFERAMHSLVGPYFSGKEELDAILQDTNEAAD